MSPEAPPTKTAPRAKRKRGGWGRRLKIPAVVCGLLLIPVAIYVFSVSREISSTFEGRLWTRPARVFSAPLTLKLGDRVSLTGIQERLAHCNYTRLGSAPGAPGQYRLSGASLDLYTRQFPLPGDPWPSRRLKVLFEGGRISSIKLQPAGRALRRAQIEPESIATFYGADREDRTVLPLSAFPKTLIEAILAAEDQRFYSHHGVDPFGIVRALVSNYRSGSVVQGGSTITQQTVKNIYLTSERSLGRKVKEAVMALVLDAKYPKDRILEVYLNEIYLGQRGSVGVCGFAEASRFYFGKEVGDLDLAESAMLAGIVRAPGIYNPITHPDRALLRKNLIVDLMLDEGRITPDEARKAKQRVPAVSKGQGGARRAPYFVEEIRQELSQDHSAEDLTENGLRIITTLDPWLQEHAEESLVRGLERLEHDRPALAKHRGGRLEGCLVALRPSTGEVLAVVGGRNFAESQFNRATQAHRQPGSLFKPFVYATGFEKGRSDSDEPFTPATLLDDEPLTVSLAGKDWSPQNYDEEYRGRVTAREALEGSLNVPTVRAAMEIGLPRIVETAEAAGMGRDLKAYPSIALGAQEVTPIDAAAAFAVFANGGRRPEPFTIAAVVGDDGKLVSRGSPHLAEVLSPQAAYVTLDLMRGVVSRGTAWTLRANGIGGDFAGKTGTTNDKRDAWFIGFRPDLLVLVWVGFDDMSETHLTGAQAAVPIWEDFVRTTGNANSDDTFTKPDGIVWASVDPATGGLATTRCPESVEEVFIDDKIPAECPEHAEGKFRKFWRQLFSGHKESEPPPPRTTIE